MAVVYSFVRSVTKLQLNYEIHILHIQRRRRIDIYWHEDNNDFIGRNNSHGMLSVAMGDMK